jgi:S1-C subfamily serine protease
MTRFAALAATIWLCFASAALGQDAVPGEMLLQRTFFIKVGNVTGTAFTIDYLGKLYFVTARHVVAGVPKRNAIIQVRQAGQWEDLHTVKTLLPPSSDADIAVFETDKKVPQPFTVTTLGKTGGVTMGQQVWFLGYPFEGLGSRFGNDNGTVLPFMKRGTMSAIDSTNPDAVVLYIDGFNNPGFSGGPIIFWNFTSHTYEIIGVVKGYRPDTAKMVINGAQVDTTVLVNSGILVGYSIKHAIQAIENDQERRP